MDILVLILTMLGVVFAAPTFIDWLNRHKPTLYLVIDSNINLMKDISRSTNDLRITYKEQPVRENVFLLKAFICYLGKDDISTEKIKSLPSLILAKDSIIHNCEILYKSNNMEVDLAVKGNVVEFSLDIIKDREFFYFEALIEQKVLSNNQYELGSRIVGVDNFKAFDYNSVDRSLNWILFRFVFVGLIWTMSVSAFGPPTDKQARIRQYNYDLYYNNESVNMEDIHKRASLTLDTLRALRESGDTLLYNDYLNKFNGDYKFSKKSLDALIRAESLLKQKVDEPSDYSKVSSYNIFSYETPMFSLGEGYSVKFKHSEPWKVISFGISTLIYFGFMVYSIITQAKYYKTRKVRSVIGNYKNDNK